jgi:Flp pilus assembly protein TadG
MSRRRQAGQSMVEFALVSMVLLVVVLGIFDFSYLFAGRIEAYQAARVAARFAATHPTAWSASATPDRTTIEGNLTVTAVPARVINDDTHITISYWLPGSGAATQCGAYSASSAAFVPVSGYTQATCLLPGTTIRVHASYDYTFITPMLRTTFSSVTVVVDASALEEA